MTKGHILHVIKDKMNNPHHSCQAHDHMYPINEYEIVEYQSDQNTVGVQKPFELVVKYDGHLRIVLIKTYEQ